MYTQSQLSALKAVFEFNSRTACKAYRLIRKALKILDSGLSLDLNMINSLSLHLSKYKHLGTEEFVARTNVLKGD